MAGEDQSGGRSLCSRFHAFFFLRSSSQRSAQARRRDHPASIITAHSSLCILHRSLFSIRSDHGGAECSGDGRSQRPQSRQHSRCRGTYVNIHQSTRRMHMRMDMGHTMPMCMRASAQRAMQQRSRAACSRTDSATVTVTVALSVCACSLQVVVVRRRFVVSPPPPTGAICPRTSRRNWRRSSHASSRYGSSRT